MGPLMAGHNVSEAQKNAEIIKQDGSYDNPSDLYLEGFRFESRLQLLSRRDIFFVFLSPFRNMPV
jgi:hypothetical protein